MDEALCYGWIDGVRKGIDEIRYANRFTPRTARSNWSAVNVKRVGELKVEGRMRPSGLAAFEARGHASTQYSYELGPRELDAAYEKTFRSNRRAWAFFEAQPPSFRRMAKGWVMSAKKEETRLRRLAMLIDRSEKGTRPARFIIASRDKPKPR